MASVNQSAKAKWFLVLLKSRQMGPICIHSSK